MKEIQDHTSLSSIFIPFFYKKKLKIYFIIHTIAYKWFICKNIYVLWLLCMLYALWLLWGHR